MNNKYYERTNLNLFINENVNLFKKRIAEYEYFKMSDFMESNHEDEDIEFINNQLTIEKSSDGTNIFCVYSNKINEHVRVLLIFDIDDKGNNFINYQIGHFDYRGIPTNKSGKTNSTSKILKEITDLLNVRYRKLIN